MPSPPPTAEAPAGGVRVDALLGGVIGLAAFTACVGLHTLAVRQVGWIVAGGIDPSIHLLGWHLFRSGPWAMPPGTTVDMGYPIGTSVALTDSIPLVAVPLKLLDGILPTPLQYIGPWLLACFVLQGVFGALLAARVVPGRAGRLLGAALFVLAPILSHRLGQAALSAHWLILAALWLNRRDAGAAAARPALGAWAAVTVCAAGTHPYLTAMVLALAGATFGTHARTLMSGVTRVAVPCLILAALAGITWWAAGYFIVPESTALQVSGFGRLSMNLLSPFIPREGALTFGHVPLTTAHYDQHEGFSYLGLGVGCSWSWPSPGCGRRSPPAPTSGCWRRASA
ncbi:MAG: DUF6311 domain-containing protein [Vicinamibacterales bacterium]